MRIQDLISPLLEQSGELAPEIREQLTALTASCGERDVAELTGLQTELQTLQDEHRALSRRFAVVELAREHRCLDVDYLDYLFERKQLDPADAATRQQFIEELKISSPRLFEAAVRSGSGGVEPASPAAAAMPYDRIGALMSELDNAPDQRR